MVAALNNRLLLAKKLIIHNSDMEVEGVLAVDRIWVTMTPFYCALFKGYKQFAVLLVYAGYTLKKERYLWTNQNVPTILVKDLEFWLWLKEVAASPLSLMTICRNVIRRSLGAHIRMKMDALFLPKAIKKFLLLEELDKNYKIP